VARLQLEAPELFFLIPETRSQPVGHRGVGRAPEVPFDFRPERLRLDDPTLQVARRCLRRFLLVVDALDEDSAPDRPCDEQDSEPGQHALQAPLVPVVCEREEMPLVFLAGRDLGETGSRAGFHASPLQRRLLQRGELGLAPLLLEGPTGALLVLRSLAGGQPLLLPVDGGGAARLLILCSPFDLGLLLVFTHSCVAEELVDGNHHRALFPVHERLDTRSIGFMGRFRGSWRGPGHEGSIRGPAVQWPDVAKDLDAQKRILVVDDDPKVGAMLRAALEAAGHSVPRIIARPEDLEGALEAVVPDLVLMDVDLGEGASGIDVAARVPAEVPVLFVSAHADPQTLAKARERGPAGFVVKPFDAIQLRAAVEMALAPVSARSRRQGPALASIPGVAALSAREREVLDQLLDNRRAPAIAKALFISHHTVRNHLKNIFAKLKVSSQQELLDLFRRKGEG
jgi:DNA-binding NarL/FixJ family response regulator